MAGTPLVMMGLQPGLWEWDGTWGCSQGLWPGDGTGQGPLAVGMARDTGVPPSKATAATRQASAELQKSPGPVRQEQRVSAMGRYLRYLPPAVPPPQELVFALSWCREAGNSLSHAVRRGASASCSCGCLACSGSNSRLCVPVRRQGSVHLYDLSNTRQAVYCRMR